MKRRTARPRPAGRRRWRARSATLGAAAAILVAGAALVQAQGIGRLAADGGLGEPDRETLPVDVRVRIVDGTTGGPGEAESLVLLERGEPPQPVVTLRDVRGESLLRGLFLDETRGYLVQATAGNIPYYVQVTGRQLMEGPVTVHVFATTTARDGLKVAELTLVVRRAEQQLSLEYMIRLQNESSPLRTILPDPTSFELALPEQAREIALEMLSAPVPTLLATTGAGEPGRIGVTQPLRAGPTRLRLTATVPYPGEADLRLSASAPVEQLTLLASPPDLELRGGFADRGLDEATGFHRWVGPPLEAGAELRWTMEGGAAPRLLAERQPAGRAAAARERQPLAGGRRLPAGALVALVALAVAALAIAAAAIRRGARARAAADKGGQSQAHESAPRPRGRRRGGGA